VFLTASTVTCVDLMIARFVHVTKNSNVCKMYEKMLSLANVLSLVHMSFFLWCLWVPLFSTDQRMIILHVALLPLIVFHWYLNNDKCSLTILESWLRDVDEEETMFHRVMSPIYSFGAVEDDCKLPYSWAMACVLWLISLNKLDYASSMKLFSTKGKLASFSYFV
jgi:hypothetical protein